MLIPVGMNNKMSKKHKSVIVIMLIMSFLVATMTVSAALTTSEKSVKEKPLAYYVNIPDGQGGAYLSPYQREQLAKVGVEVKKVITSMIKTAKGLGK